MNTLQKTSSVLWLILANLVPLYGVIFLGWELFPIMFLYWLESAIVGGLNVMKLYMVSRNQPHERWALGIIPFFIVHYGIFMTVHGGFVFAYFWTPGSSLAEVAGAFLSLIISHGISFWTNFVGKKEYLRRTPDQQMFQPYGRIVVMHLTIIFGGIVAKSAGSPPLALAVMVVVKTVIDVLAHLSEHNKLVILKDLQPKRE